MKAKWEFGGREKVLLIVVILLLAAVSVKSLYFDTYMPPTELEERLAIEAMEGRSEEGIVHWRVVNIRDIRTPQESLEYQKVIQLRRYLLYIIPIGEGTIYR